MTHASPDDNMIEIDIGGLEATITRDGDTIDICIGPLSLLLTIDEAMSLSDAIRKLAQPYRGEE